MKETHKLSKEEYYKLWDDSISKREYDSILVKIDYRFNYIMKTICTKLDWYDYDNGWEGRSGHFEPNTYYKDEDSYIIFDGEYSLPPPYDSCPDIPIRWLWEDFEEEFKREAEEEKKKILDKKNKAKAARLDFKLKKESMREIIKNKLTKEELKFVKFK